MDAAKVRLASRLMTDPDFAVGEVCKAVSVSSATLYRYVGPEGTIRKMP